MDHLKKRLIHGGAWTFLFKVTASLGAMVTYAILARLLSEKDLGAYFLTFSIVSFAAIVAQAGMSKSAVRLLAESFSLHQTGRAVAALRITFRYVTIGIFVISAVLLLGGGRWLAKGIFQAPSIAQIMGLVVLWIALLTFQRYFAEVFRGLHDARFAALFEGALTSTLSALFLGLFWILHEKLLLPEAVLIVTGASGIALLIATCLLKWKFPAGEPDDSTISQQEVWTLAWPIFVTTVGIFIVNRADIWIVGAGAEKADVAMYGAALRMTLLINLPMMVVNSVMQSTIAELYAKNDRERLERILQTGATIAAIPVILILTVIIFWGDAILAVVFTPQYARGAGIFSILCAGRTVNVLAGSCGQCLMMGGHQRLMMKTSLFFGFTSVLAASLSVKPFGVSGVATVFAIGMAVKNITQATLVRKFMGMKTYALIPRFNRQQ